MASTNKTTNFSLNLWEPGDQVLRADFNRDNQKIEEALIKQRPVFGSYTGNGDYTLGLNVSLGFRPSALVIATKRTPGEGYQGGVMAVAVDGLNNEWVTITADGFIASQSMINNSTISNPYRYIAWR